MIRVNSLLRLQRTIAYPLFPNLFGHLMFLIGCTTTSTYYLQTIPRRYNSIQLFFHYEFLPYFNKILITQQLDIAVCPQKACFQHTKPGNLKNILVSSWGKLWALSHSTSTLRQCDNIRSTCCTLKEKILQLLQFSRLMR